MKPQLKYLLLTIGFYLAYIAAAVALDAALPAGPCVPGITFVMLMALLPISILGFIITVILHFSWRRNNSWAIWCHFAVLLIFIIALV